MMVIHLKLMKLVARYGAVGYFYSTFSATHNTMLVFVTSAESGKRTTRKTPNLRTQDPKPSNRC